VQIAGKLLWEKGDGLFDRSGDRRKIVMEKGRSHENCYGKRAMAYLIEVAIA